MSTNQENNGTVLAANGVEADEVVNGPDCVNCGNNKYVVRIAWGMVANNTGSIDRHPASRFFLGGGEDVANEAWHCNKCGTNF